MEHTDAAVLLPIDQLLEDPMNQEAFDEGDIRSLAADMQERGFLGVISAYPVEGSTYRVESGHRRLKAAKEAGLTRIPVLITEPPKSDYERRTRLARWNLHVRPSTAIGTAKLAHFLSETYEQDNRERKLRGEPTLPILERVAHDLETSSSNISKYKALLSLIPELQSVADDGKHSWAVLSKAAQLSERQQKMLARSIVLQEKLGKTAGGSWINNEIEKLRCISDTNYTYLYDRNEIGRYEVHKEEEESEESDKRVRRRDGDKEIRKALELLEDALSDGAFLRDQAKETRRNRLEKIRKLAEDALH